jgi:hypothetical protein
VEGAADGEVEFVWLRREAARGGRNSGEGEVGVGPDRVRWLEEEVGKR